MEPFVGGLTRLSSRDTGELLNSKKVEAGPEAVQGKTVYNFCRPYKLRGYGYTSNAGFKTYLPVDEPKASLATLLINKGYVAMPYDGHCMLHAVNSICVYLKHITELKLKEVIHPDDYKLIKVALKPHKANKYSMEDYPFSYFSLDELNRPQRVFAINELELPATVVLRSHLWINLSRINEKGLENVHTKIFVGSNLIFNEIGESYGYDLPIKFNADELKKIRSVDQSGYHEAVRMNLYGPNEPYGICKADFNFDAFVPKIRFDGLDFGSVGTEDDFMRHLKTCDLVTDDIDTSDWTHHDMISVGFIPFAFDGYCFRRALLHLHLGYIYDPDQKINWKAAKKKLMEKLKDNLIEQAQAEALWDLPPDCGDLSIIENFPLYNLDQYPLLRSDAKLLPPFIVFKNHIYLNRLENDSYIVTEINGPIIVGSSLNSRLRAYTWLGLVLLVIGVLLMPHSKNVDQSRVNLHKFVEYRRTGYCQLGLYSAIDPLGYYSAYDADPCKDYGDDEWKKMFKIAMLKNHPDKGGSDEKARLIPEARNFLQTAKVRYCYTHNIYFYDGQNLLCFKDVVDRNEVYKTIIDISGEYYAEAFIALYKDLVYAVLEIELMLFTYGFILGFINWLVGKELTLITMVRGVLQNYAVTYVLIAGCKLLMICLNTWSIGVIGLYGAKGGKSKIKNKKPLEAIPDFREVEYKVTRDHPHHIEYQVEIEKLDAGASITHYVYWMPTEGFCTQLASVFYLALKSCFESEIIDQMDPLMVLKLIPSIANHSYISLPTDRGVSSGCKNAFVEGVVEPVTFDDDEELAKFRDSNYNFIKDEILDKFNLPNKALLNPSEVCEVFKSLKIKTARGGQFGVVYANCGEVRHFGVMTTWVPQSYAVPRMLCSFEAVVNSYPFVSAFQNSYYCEGMPKAPASSAGWISKVTHKIDVDALKKNYLKAIVNRRILLGITDVMVEIGELTYLLKAIRVPFQIRIKQGKATKLWMKYADSPQSLKILYDQDKLHFSLDENDYNSEPLPLGDYEEKSDIEEKVEKPKSKVVDALKQICSKYDIEDPYTLGGQGYFLTYHWMPQTSNVGKYADEFFHATLDRIWLGRDRNMNFLRAISAPGDDYYIGTTAYRAIEYLNLGPVRVVVRIHVTAQNFVLNRKLLRYSFKKRYTQDDKHESLLQEWFALPGNIDLIRKDIEKSVIAVKLYLSASTDVLPDNDWVATHLIMLERNSANVKTKYQNIVENKLELQVLQDNLRGIWEWINEFWNGTMESLDLYRALYTGSILTLFMLFVTRLLIAFWDFDIDFPTFIVVGIIFTSWCFVIPAWVIATVLIERWSRHKNPDIWYGSIVVKYLSDNKFMDFFDYTYFKNASLNKLKFFDRRKLVSTEHVVTQRMGEKNKLDGKIYYSHKLPQEFRKYLAGLAPSETVAAIWAFLFRQTRPKRVVEYKHEELFPRSGEGLVSEVISDINQAIKKTKLLTAEEYLLHVESNKRAGYKRGMERFWKKPFLPSTLTLFAKGNEKQVKKGQGFNKNPDTHKPRIICGPSEQVKGVCGWVMHNMLKVCKKSSLIGKSICCGLTPTALEERITLAMQSMMKKGYKPIVVCADGTMWDAHQGRHFIQSVDNNILKNVAPKIMGLMGFTASMIKAILNNLTSVYQKVVLISKDKRFPFKSKMKFIMEAILTGTVYSGHASKTTWGNTVRAILWFLRICRELKAKWNENFYHFQAGDDAFTILDEKDLDNFLRLFEKYNTEEESYGLLFQDITVFKDAGEFLSQDGFYAGGRFHLMRKPEKVINTAMFTDKIDDKNMAAFENGIADQLSAAYKNFPGIREFANWRKTQGVKTDKKILRSVEAEKPYLQQIDQAYVSQAGIYAKIRREYKILAACGGNPIPLLKQFI